MRKMFLATGERCGGGSAALWRQFRAELALPSWSRSWPIWPRLHEDVDKLLEIHMKYHESERQ